MNIIWQSKHFAADKVVSTYARLYSNGEVGFYDVDIRHKTIREWWVQKEEVAADTVEKLQVGKWVLTSGMTMQERKARRK